MVRLHGPWLLDSTHRSQLDKVRAAILHDVRRDRRSRCLADVPHLPMNYAILL